MGRGSEGWGGCDSGLLIKGTIWLESLFCCSSQPHQSPGRDTFVLVLVVLLHIVPESVQVLEFCMTRRKFDPKNVANVKLQCECIKSKMIGLCCVVKM